MSVLILLADGFEEMEAITLIDIARRAGIEILSSSLCEEKFVCGSHNILIKTDLSFEEMKSKTWNCIVLPGGMRGVENILQNEGAMRVLAAHAKADGRFAAICAAPLILDTLGILKDLEFTCHPSVKGQVKGGHYLNRASVESRNILTGRSAGTAVSWALHFVNWTLGTTKPSLLEGLAFVENDEESSEK